MKLLLKFELWIYNLSDSSNGNIYYHDICANSHTEKHLFP